MVFTSQRKRDMTGAIISGIIIDKFGHEQRFSPNILFKIKKCTKIFFYCTILIIDVTINLKVKCGGKPMFDSKNAIK